MSQGEVYIVDYDLPSDYRRKRFYRRIRRWWWNRGQDPPKMSTASVVITRDETLAWFVYRAARAVGGEAHVYRATQLDTEP